MNDTRGLKVGDPVFDATGLMVARVHTVEEKIFGFGCLEGAGGIPRGPLYVLVDGERIDIPDEIGRTADIAVMADG